MRLIDASIIIACSKTGWLERLFEFADIAITQGVHGELQRGKDDLPFRTQHIVTNAVDEMEIANNGGEFRTLRAIQQHGRRISFVDAQQVTFVRLHTEHTLYMRDRKAARAAATGGGDIRDHQTLADDMYEEGILSRSEADRMRQDLCDYFERSAP